MNENNRSPNLAEIRAVHVIRASRALHRYPPTPRKRLGMWAKGHLGPRRRFRPLFTLVVGDFKLRRQFRASGDWLIAPGSEDFNLQAPSWLLQFRLRRLHCRRSGHQPAKHEQLAFCSRCYQLLDDNGLALGYLRLLGMRNGLIFGAY